MHVDGVARGLASGITTGAVSTSEAPGPLSQRPAVVADTGRRGAPRSTRPPTRLSLQAAPSQAEVAGALSRLIRGVR